MPTSVSINQNPRFVYAEHFWWPLYSLVPLPSSRSLRSPSSPLLPSGLSGFYSSGRRAFPSSLLPARLRVTLVHLDARGIPPLEILGTWREEPRVTRLPARAQLTKGSASREGNRAFLSRARISDELCLNFLLGIKKNTNLAREERFSWRSRVSCATAVVLSD